MSRIKDMTGQRIGKLYVVGRGQSNNGVYWHCKCDCGNESVVKGTHLRFGQTKSCGCGSIEQALANCKSARTAKMVPYPFSRKMKDVRRNMLDRCYNPANNRWENYGGRGIVVCEEWQRDSRAFYKFLFEQGWSPGLTIDRVDVNGNYEPSNCRFVDVFVQQNNTTRNHFLEWNGERKTISQWARTIGVRPMALEHRVARGWSIQRIFTQPFRASRYKQA